MFLRCTLLNLPQIIDAFWRIRYATSSLQRHTSKGGFIAFHSVRMRKNVIATPTYLPLSTTLDRSSVLTAITDDEVVNIVVGVGITRLQREHRRVGRRVQLHHRLHRQRPVDEVGRLVVHVLHVYDHPLVVRVCKRTQV